MFTFVGLDVWIYSGLGSLGNLIIILFLFLRLEERNRMENWSVNLTVGCIAGSNIFLCLFTGVTSLLNSPQSTFSDLAVSVKIIIFLLCVALRCTLLFTALLCLLYCVKILPSQNFLFEKFRKNLNKLVHWTLFGGLVISSAFSGFEVVLLSPSSNITGDVNATKLNNCSSSIFRQWMYLSLFGMVYILVPFTVMVTSCFSVMVYLRAHIVKLKSGTTEIQNPQVKQQKRVVVMLCVQLLLYSVLLVIVLINMLLANICGTNTDISYMMYFPIYCFTSSLNIIFRNGSIRRKMRFFFNKIWNSLVNTTTLLTWHNLCHIGR